MPSNHPILCCPLPPAPKPSQHQGLFQWVGSSHQVVKILEPQSFHLWSEVLQWFHYLLGKTRRYLQSFSLNLFTPVPVCTVESLVISFLFLHSLSYPIPDFIELKLKLGFRFNGQEIPHVISKVDLSFFFSSLTCAILFWHVFEKLNHLKVSHCRELIQVCDAIIFNNLCLWDTFF